MIANIDLGFDVGDSLGFDTCSLQSSEKEIGHRPETSGIPDMPNMTMMKTAMSDKPLTSKEKRHLAEACLRHSHFVKAIAKEYMRKGSGMELEDLMQIAYFGLVNAVRRWREGDGSKFTTIARLDIRDALRTAVGEAHNMNKDRDLIRGAVSIEEEEAEQVADECETPEESFARLEENQQVHNALDNLSDEDRSLLLSFADGVSDSELSRNIGQPRETIRNTRMRAIDHLRDEYLDQAAA